MGISSRPQKWSCSLNDKLSNILEGQAFTVFGLYPSRMVKTVDFVELYNFCSPSIPLCA